MRPTVYLLLLFSTSILSAQTLQVENVLPANQLTDAGANNIIQITFDSPIDGTTITGANIKVFGRWSGPAAVSFTISADTRTVQIMNAEPFMAGEWVTVNVSKNVTSMEGMAMEHSYSWGFWTMTDYYDPIYQPLDTIELRAPGEGLLQSYGAYAGDLNNDGYSDLTVINETSDDLRILLNDGSGGYENYELIPLNSGTPSPNEGADFNGDGEIDFAVCTAHNDQMRVLFGDGSGTLGDMDNYTTGVNARGLGVIDFDGDGHDDIVIANRGSSNLSLFRNDGTGAFTSSTINSPGEGESGLVVTDFNNDGIQDLIIGMYDSQEIVVMLGDGAMGFTASDQVDVLGRPWMMAAGDLNNDGFGDVASVNSTGHNVCILLNDGNGGFLPPSYLIDSGSNFPLAIDLGDLNGDGYLDIVSSYYSTTNFLVYFNNGNGSFSLRQSLNASTYASCAILHDRDNDGRLDITGVDEGDDLVFIYEGIDNISSVNTLQNDFVKNVHPNPFKDQLMIELVDACNDCQLAIYNEAGVLIRKIPVDQSQARWDGKLQNGLDAPSGIYWLQLRKGNEVHSQKVVKLK